MHTVGHLHTKNTLLSAFRQNHLGHALLFTERPGSGSFPLAVDIASEIIGEKNSGAKFRCQKLQHPDLHLSFPVVQSQQSKVLKCADFIQQYQQFMLQQPFANINDWLQHLDVERKLPAINVAEIQDLVFQLSIKSYEGGAKIYIIWLAEFMNANAANKLLKVLEEPTPNTYLFLITEKPEKLLPTITSRCQTVNLKPLQTNEIQEYLINQQNIPESQAGPIAAMAAGNMNTALKLIRQEANEFEGVFVEWVRSAFLVKSDVSKLKSIVEWSQKVAGWPRDKQLNLAEFSSELFRKAVLTNYQAGPLGTYIAGEKSFNFQKFSAFIHGGNIAEILETLDEAAYHISQNANGKLVWLDTSIKLTRLLHSKI